MHASILARRTWRTLLGLGRRLGGRGLRLHGHARLQVFQALPPFCQLHLRGV